jgi:hypothetical protein
LRLAADGKADKEKNPVDFAFKKRQELRNVLSIITVEIEGTAESSAYIAEVLDVSSGTSDEKLTSGDVVTLLGSRIKIDGLDASCGLYILNAVTGLAQKVPGNLVENHANRVSAQLPNLSAGTYRVRVITQFTSSGFLKEPRQIDYALDLTVSP